jgi:DtxR family Mn-dependent transcriptional regulator
MLQPLIALIVGVLIVALLVVLFWPDRGLFWSFVRARHATQRVLMEDALKHMFDCESKGRQGSIASLSGVLNVTRNRAAELLGLLEAAELVTLASGEYELSDEGRQYALRVVRVHRLWESHLSHETGLEPTSWHREAEIREHTLSPAEVEALAARLGDPRYDPHGDPIPTADGEIAPPPGMPLTDLPLGEMAEIVHVEDEPEAVFAQLVAEGLYPGMRVRVLETTPQRLRFEADAEEHVLAPVLAANLSVVALPREVEMEGPFERLSSLAVGESAEVVSLLPGLRSPERRRMMDLGLLPGTVVEAELRSPAGDPTGYRVRGAVIALRRDQADHIRIQRSA